MAEKKTQEQKRNERAERLCREVRFQMAKYGRVEDTATVFGLLNSWMRFAKQNKYTRP